MWGSAIGGARVKVATAFHEVELPWFETGNMAGNMGDDSTDYCLGSEVHQERGLTYEL